MKGRMKGIVLYVEGFSIINTIENRNIYHQYNVNISEACDVVRIESFHENQTHGLKVFLARQDRLGQYMILLKPNSTHIDANRINSKKRFSGIIEYKPVKYP